MQPATAYRDSCQLPCPDKTEQWLGSARQPAAGESCTVRAGIDAERAAAADLICRYSKYSLEQQRELGGCPSLR